MTLKAYNNFLKKDLEVVATFGRDGEHAVYADALKPFARILKTNIRNEYQNVVVVAGPTGSGKSTLAIQLCKLMDPKWSLSDNYIYSVQDLKDKLNNPNASPISLFDEGSVSLNSSNSQRKDDKLMVVLFDTMRSLGWTSVICIPSMDDLNKRIREHHVNYLLKCPARSPIKGYDPRGFCKMYVHESRDWGKGYYQWVATTIYGDLPKKDKEEYHAIKKAHQLELLNHFIESEED